MVLQSLKDPMIRDFAIVCDPVMHGRFLVPGTEYQAMFHYAEQHGGADDMDDGSASDDIMMIDSPSGKLFAIRTSGKTLGVLSKHFKYDRRAPDFLVRHVVNRYTSDLARNAYHHLVTSQPVISSALNILGPRRADDLYNMLIPWIGIIRVLYQTLLFDDLEPLAKIMGLDKPDQSGAHARVPEPTE